MLELSEYNFVYKPIGVQAFSFVNSVVNSEIQYESQPQ